MRKLRTASKLDSLALHVAGGSPATDWSREHGVSVRTTYEWLSLDEVKDRISAIRGRLFDEGVGKLITTIRKATTELDRLIDGGSSDNVRLAAARGALADAMAMSDFANLERRISALEAGRGNAVVQRTDSPHPEA